MKPLISIIVPVYNAEKYLNQCLDSLQNQTYQNMEFVLVDDGSTDGSAAICAAYAEKDSRFRYLHQENGGVSAARNAGIDAASGAYLGFCDSDDWVETDMYETLYSLIETQQADVAVVSFFRAGDSTAVDDPTIFTYTAHEALLQMHTGILFAGHLCNKLIKAELFDGVRLDKDIVLLEDMLAMWDVFHRCNKVAFRNTQKYHYFYNPQSAMRSVFKDSYFSMRVAAGKMLDKMTAHYPEDAAYAARTLLASDYQLALRLSRAGRLDRAQYADLKADFDRYYDNTAPLFTADYNKKIRLFLTGRTVFNVYIRLSTLLKKL